MTGVSSLPSGNAVGDDGVVYMGDDGLPLGEDPYEDSPAVRAILAQKQAGTLVEATRATVESSYLPRNHQAQIYSNYCGPATMAMALDHMGVTRTQSELAKLGGISPGGSGIGIYTMRSVLNNIGASHGFAWDIQALPYTPSANDKAVFKARLVNSVTGQTGSGKKYPLTANIHVVPNGPRPPGYPAGDVRHHFEIRGFKQYGEWAQIQDPASSVWAAVDAHYPLPSNDLVVMIGDRAYLY